MKVKLVESSVHEVVEFVLDVGHHSAFSVLLLHDDFLAVGFVVVGGLGLAVALAPVPSHFVGDLGVLFESSDWVDIGELLLHLVRVVGCLDGCLLMSMSIVGVVDSVGRWAIVAWH